MANASQKAIAEAYELIAKAERSSISSVRDKAQDFIEALDSAIGTLPGGRMPQTAGLTNLTSWRSQVQVIVQNLDVLMNQYPTEEAVAALTPPPQATVNS